MKKLMAEMVGIARHKHTHINIHIHTQRAQDIALKGFVFSGLSSNGIFCASFASIDSIVCIVRNTDFAQTVYKLYENTYFSYALPTRMTAEQRQREANTGQHRRQDLPND